VEESGVLRFAEQVVGLVDTGRKSATYKLATILAILEVAAAHTTGDGAPPESLRALEVADRVLELYWPQTMPWDLDPDGNPAVLRQSPQNDIPWKLAAFRRRAGLGRRSSLADAAAEAPVEWAPLRDELRAVVVGMPLAKLQRFGDGRFAREDRFIYDFDWREELGPSALRQPDFDDTMRLRPNVGRWLIQLSPLLRPVIQTKWAALVARQNSAIIGDHHLNEFLFGADRVALDRVRGPLTEMQQRRCFYCDGPLASTTDVDHFLPWSRQPDNTLDNLVASHRGCNGAKSASIAALRHLERWLERRDVQQLDDIARTANWPRSPLRTMGLVRSTYLWLPAGAPLWLEASRYEALERDRLVGLLAA
jgi:5-methylcytosine-specific restriction endonuclease McrA